MTVTSDQLPVKADAAKPQHNSLATGGFQLATVFAGCGYAAIFGFSFIATKKALLTLAPLELLALRFALATAVMLALAMMGIVKLSYKGKPLWPLALACLFEPVAYFLCETYGLRECATGTAGLMLGAIPVAVALLAWPALGERPGWARLGFLLVSLTGVGTIALGSNNGENTPRGVALLFSATAAASLFNVISRRMSRHFSPAEVTFAMMASAAVVFGTVAFLGAGTAPVTGGLTARTIQALPAVAYLGCLSSVLAFFLVNFNLGRLRAARSAVFSNLSTAVSVAAGVIFLGEAFGWTQAAGAALILAGVWGANSGLSRAKPPETVDSRQ